MTAPRRNHLNKASEATLADGQGPSGDLADGSAAAALQRPDSRGRNDDWDELDWKQRKGRAFSELLEHLPTERLTGKVASTVIVTMSLEQVLGAARTAELHGQIETATGATAESRPSNRAADCDTGHQHSTSPDLTSDITLDGRGAKAVTFRR